MTPYQYYINIKIDKAQSLLEENISVVEIIIAGMTAGKVWRFAEAHHHFVHEAPDKTCGPAVDNPRRGGGDDRRGPPRWKCGYPNSPAQAVGAAVMFPAGLDEPGVPGPGVHRGRPGGRSSHI
jgi:hypothetical protein